MSPRETTACPRCGFELPGGSECLRCGVVFAKLRAGAGLPRRRSVRSAPARVGSRRSATGWLLLLLAAVAAAAWVQSRPSESDGALPADVRVLSQKPGPRESPAPPPVSESSPVRQVAEEAFVDSRELSPPPAAAAPARRERPRHTFRQGYGWLEDARGFRDGIGYAVKEGRMMTLYVYTDWCPYCRELEGGILSDVKVKDCLAYSVKVRVNPEHGPAEHAVSKLFGVHGFPSLFFYDPATGSAEKLKTSVTEDEFAAACRETLG